PPAFHPKMNKEKVLVFRKYWNNIGFVLKNIEQKNRGKRRNNPSDLCMKKTAEKILEIILNTCLTRD
ncbi:hypothetical protein, partial [Oceanobacillus sojae]|uniref:hypothetical protein n=1 Tax=Oceanobacillus sojae TaxID=582851 RepID=UPI0021A351CF